MSLRAVSFPPPSFNRTTQDAHQLFITMGIRNSKAERKGKKTSGELTSTSSDHLSSSSPAEKATSSSPPPPAAAAAAVASSDIPPPAQPPPAEGDQDVLFSQTPASKVNADSFQLLKVVGKGSFGKVGCHFSPAPLLLLPLPLLFCSPSSLPSHR